MHPTTPTTTPLCDLTAPCAPELKLPWQERRVGLAEAANRFAREAQHAVFDTGRYRCPYYIWGDGPPLIFIHGLADAARSFLLPMTLLSEHFRCIAYDLPDGITDGCRLGRYRHSDYVADLLALLDHLELRQAYLFGSSFGSTIALAVLYDQPERFPRAVLQGGFARRPLAWAEVALAKMARYWPGPMRRLPFRSALLKLSHERAFLDRSADVWDFFVKQTGLPPMSAVAHRALTLHGLDLRPILASIRQPVLLICGECDPLVGKLCEEELLAGLPNATRVQITSCGHMAQFSHPEVVAGLTDHFLTPPPCAAGH